jgi:hypothetical protein
MMIGECLAWEKEIPRRAVFDLLGQRKKHSEWWAIFPIDPPLDRFKPRDQYTSRQRGENGAGATNQNNMERIHI